MKKVLWVPDSYDESGDDYKRHKIGFRPDPPADRDVELKTFNEKESNGN